MAARYDSSGMKKTIYLLAMLGLFAACEQKTTTVNPPAEKKESNTTIVNPPSEKKETKTDINVNTSPNPYILARFIERAFPVTCARARERAFQIKQTKLSVLSYF